jgi:hypothetical protein
MKTVSTTTCTISNYYCVSPIRCPLSVSSSLRSTFLITPSLSQLSIAQVPQFAQLISQLPNFRRSFCSPSPPRPPPDPRAPRTPTSPATTTTTPASGDTPSSKTALSLPLIDTDLVLFQRGDQRRLQARADRGTAEPRHRRRGLGHEGVLLVRGPRRSHLHRHLRRRRERVPARGGASAGFRGGEEARHPGGGAGIADRRRAGVTPPHLPP